MLSRDDILRVAHLIVRSPTRRLSLDSLARLSGWSKYHLQRSFRALLNESPKQFQQRLALEEAALQLHSTGKPILDIALSTGYESHEVFTRAFRRRFDCSPSDYRKIASNKPQNDRERHSRVVRRVGPCVGLYHVTFDKPEGEAKMATSEISQIELEPQPILFIQRQVPHTALQSLFSECFPKLFGHCIQNGYEMAGNPIARYPDYTPGMATVDCIIPLQRPADSSGEMQAGELQAGSAAFATHTGPYDTLGETYGAIEAWMKDNGFRQNGPNWERYVTDPSDVPDPKDWKTDVFFPIKENDR